MLRRFAISCVLAALMVPALARTRPHYGGTLRIETEGDPWQRPDGLARRLIFDGLTTLGTDGDIHPALAVEWESENNDHRWQLRLRPGVHFQDGTPLTSIAVVSSLMSSCASNCPWTAVRAAGSSSVVFTNDEAMPNLPALLSSDEFLIALAVSADGGTPQRATGTGPFQLTGFSNGVLSFAANDTCWRGRPFIDTIEIRGRRSIADQWLDLSAGRTDMVDVPAEELRHARQQHLTIAASPASELLALQVSDAGLLSNPNLRGAIALSIDRSALANVIFQHEAQVTASLLPQALSGYAFLFSSARDLNKARELRGGLTSPSLTLRTEGDGALQLAAQRIALNLREAGINVQVAGGSSQHADLTLRLLPLECGKPAAILEALTRAQNQKLSPTRDSDALTLYKQERDVLEHKTLIPLLHVPRAYAVSARVRDLQLLSDGTPDIGDASLEAAQ